MAKAGKSRSWILGSKQMSLFIGVVIIALMIVVTRNTIVIDAIEAKSMNLNFFMTDVFRRPEEISKGVYKINTAKGVRNDIAIFGFDEKSLEEFGQWPWPRGVFADFLANVNKSEEISPTGVLIDVLFTENSQDRSQDLVLSDALRRYGSNTVVDLFADVSSQIPVESAEMRERMEMLAPQGVRSNDDVEQIVNVITPPIREIVRSGVKIAPATSLFGINARLAEKEADKTARRFALVVKIKDRYYPSTVLWLAMLHYKVGLENLEINMGRSVVLRGATAPGVKGAPAVKRDVVIPIDNQGTVLINFYGRAGTFQVKSFSDAAKGRVSPKFFKSKTILVGVYAEGLQDIHQTPLGRMYGVEMIANAVNQILNGEYIHTASDWVNVALIVVLGLLISYIVGRRSILISYVATFVLVIVYFFVVVFLFDRYRYALNLSAPLITSVITLFTMIAYRILTEEKEKKAIRGTFSKYVTKSVVDELLKHPEKLELGGEDKVITVLFSDIRGFTTMSEKLTPQELVSHLNEYLSAMTDIIFKYDGTLDKYVGDEIMAFWNAPIEQENHAELACLAALEMMDKLEKLNAAWPDEKRLNIGIGLNTGAMTVGNMGSTSRMNYTLMGDSVNLGARLEGTNKFYGTNIIISEFTYEIVKGKFVCRELDTLRVKGKNKPVRIYEIMDAVEERAAVPSG